jgi:hypothetical protein
MHKKQITRIIQVVGLTIWFFVLLWAYKVGLFIRFGLPRVLIWVGLLLAGWLIIAWGLSLLLSWLIKE